MNSKKVCFLGYTSLSVHMLENGPNLKEKQKYRHNI